MGNPPPRPLQGAQISLYILFRHAEIANSMPAGFQDPTPDVCAPGRGQAQMPPRGLAPGGVSLLAGAQRPWFLGPGPSTCPPPSSHTTLQRTIARAPLSTSRQCERVIARAMIFQTILDAYGGAFACCLLRVV